jgi:hypothetical protein
MEMVQMLMCLISMTPQTPTHWALLNAVAAGLPVGFVFSPILLSI